jgi:hypothetical protein
MDYLSFSVDVVVNFTCTGPVLNIITKVDDYSLCTTSLPATSMVTVPTVS